MNGHRRAGARTLFMRVGWVMYSNTWGCGGGSAASIEGVETMRSIGYHGYITVYVAFGIGLLIADSRSYRHDLRNFLHLPVVTLG